MRKTIKIYGDLRHILKHTLGGGRAQEIDLDCVCFLQIDRAIFSLTRGTRTFTDYKIFIWSFRKTLLFLQYHISFLSAFNYTGKQFRVNNLKYIHECTQS